MAREVSFTDLAVEAGLWYILSLRFDDEISQYLSVMTPGEISQLAQRLGINPQMKSDLEQVIETEAHIVEEQMTIDAKADRPIQNYSIPRLEYVWARIVLGRYWASSAPQTTIASAQYEKLRAREVASRGIISAQGVSRWPATCQTLTKRCGGSWNEALKSFGLATASRGRVRGTLKFNEKHYPQAAALFIKHCQNIGKNPTVNYYGQWVAREKKQGRSWPSSAAQRQVCGTWLKVLASGEKMVGKVPSKPVSK